MADLQVFCWKADKLELAMGIDAPATFAKNLKEGNYNDYDRELGDDILTAEDIVEQKIGMEGLSDEQFSHVEFR